MDKVYLAHFVSGYTVVFRTHQGACLFLTAEYGKGDNVQYTEDKDGNAIVIVDDKHVASVFEMNVIDE